MLSANNILSPATGRPITVPTQDMVFGIYYLTLSVDGAKGEGRVFRHAYEVERAFDAGDMELHAKIEVRPEAGSHWPVRGPGQRGRARRGRQSDRQDEDGRLELETTPGRVLFNEALPEGFRYVNDMVGKRNTPIGVIVEEVAANYPKASWRPASTPSRRSGSATPRSRA